MQVFCRNYLILVLNNFININMKNKKEQPETLGSRLQHLLDDYGLSPEKLAALVGMTGVSIRAITKDESKPYRTTVDKIAEALGTTYDWLTNGVGEKLPNGKVSVSSNKSELDPWKEEAWTLAKEQIAKKDATIDRLAVSFDRLTEFMSKIDPSVFLFPVKDAG